MRTTIALVLMSSLLISAHAANLAASLKLRTKSHKTSPVTRTAMRSSRRDAHLEVDVHLCDNCYEILSGINIFKRQNRYGIFIINTDTFFFEPEFQGPWTATYDEMLGHLKADQPRFVVFGYNYEAANGNDFLFTLFIEWIPEDASMSQKMKYAGYSTSFRNSIDTMVTIRASTIDELAPAAINAKLAEKMNGN